MFILALTYNTTSDEDIERMLILYIYGYKEIRYGWINKWIDDNMYSNTTNSV
jgi:hypothetical protein